MKKIKVALLAIGTIAIGIVFYFAAQGIILQISQVPSFTPG